MKKRISSFALAVALCLGILIAVPGTANAAAPLVSGEWEYVVIGNEAHITKYSGQAANIVFPSEIGGYPVTQIGFYNEFRQRGPLNSQRNSITSVVVPEGVRVIGDYGLSDLNNATSIKLPDSLITIGYSAFLNNESITSINIPQGVTSIGESAFQGCRALTGSIVIPQGVTKISIRLFSECSGLSEVILHGGITEIEMSAFAHSGITRMNIPHGVTKIGNNAFYQAIKLETVSIPKSVTEIPFTDYSGSFSSAPSLRSITVEPGNTHFKSLDGVLFSGDMKTLLKYPEAKPEASFVVPNGVEKLMAYSFADTSKLLSITLPDTLTTIGRIAFRDSGIGGVVIPDSVTDIGDYAFTNCKSLASVKLPNRITVIKWETFFECNSLVEVVIPGSVTEIGVRAFGNCQNLQSVSVPSSVSEIGLHAFHYDGGLSGAWILPDLIIYGSAGSEIEQYAKEQGHPFVVRAGLDVAPPTAPMTPPTAPPSTPALIAAPTASTVLVNGESVAFDAYNIGGNNYFKLRDLAYVLSGTEKQFEVGWDGANNAIALTSGEAYTEVGGEMTGKGAGNKTPTATTSKIFLDGAEVQFTAYNIEGNNYFKLRDIGETFDFEVDWDGARNTIVIDTRWGYTPD